MPPAADSASEYPQAPPELATAPVAAMAASVMIDDNLIGCPAVESPESTDEVLRITKEYLSKGGNEAIPLGGGKMHSGKEDIGVFYRVMTFICPALCPGRIFPPLCPRREVLPAA